MFLIDFLLTVFAVLLLVPVLVLLVQVLAAYFLSLPDSSDEADRAFTIAVLVPAHNESTGIIDTLRSIMPQLNATDRLLVVADNCTDDTAIVAKAQGAEVIVRTHDTERGKGYALDFGLQYLAQQPCDVLVIVDADCIVEPKSLKKLAFCSLKHHRPVQALYLMHSKNSATLKAKIAAFAWCVKNWVRPLGFAKLGLPCQLMGTGMAFPWALMMKADLANGNIVEDMKLGIDFCHMGVAPMFYPYAKVTSFFPLTNTVQKGQSRRWEHGHLAMILTEVPQLLSIGLRKRHLPTIAMALDLSVPPLALLVGLIFTLAMVTVLFSMGLSSTFTALTISFISVAALVVAILCAWWGWGKNILSLSSMLYIPIYILLKIPNYLSFMIKRQSTWNKTKREQE